MKKTLICAVIYLITFSCLLAQNLIPYKENSKWGYCDKNGVVVIPSIYDDASCFYQGVAIVAKNNAFGLIDSLGKEITPITYMEISPFSEGFAACRSNKGMWGYLNTKGVEAVPCTYDHQPYMFMKFKEGRGKVLKDGLFGFVDKTGALVVECKYNVLNDYNNGIALGIIDNTYHYIDYTGKELFPVSYTAAGPFSDGMAKVSAGGKLGYINETGKEVIPCKFTRASDFGSGRAFVEENGAAFVIDKTGKKCFDVSEVGFSSYFSEGLACIRNKDNKWGFIDVNGSLVIPFEFSAPSSFKKSYSIIMKNGRFGVIDKQGKTLINHEYEMFYLGIQDSLLKLRKKGVDGYVDLTGKEYFNIKKEAAIVDAIRQEKAEREYRLKLEADSIAAAEKQANQEDYAPYVAGTYSSFKLKLNGLDNYSGSSRGEKFEIKKFGKNQVLVSTNGSGEKAGYKKTLSLQFSMTTELADIKTLGFKIIQGSLPAVALKSIKGVTKKNENEKLDYEFSDISGIFDANTGELKLYGSIEYYHNKKIVKKDNLEIIAQK